MKYRAGWVSLGLLTMAVIAGSCSQNRGDKKPPSFEEESEGEHEPAEEANGSVDVQALQQAVAQREQLKPGIIPSRPHAPDSKSLLTQTPPFDSNWSQIGPANWANTTAGPFGGRVEGIAAVGSGAQIFVAGLGGVMKSTDGGATWASVSDSWQTPSVLSLAVKVDGAQTIVYAGAGFLSSGGIKKSTDGGSTWSTVGAAAFPVERSPTSSSIPTILSGYSRYPPMP